ncbi:CHASE2 domain-containing protein [Candidatus Venteria ishoeyi]|nr:adenylate/guanylate cyclase domain-containing protein [Candidatus Venteria ishoeyi]
MVSLLAGLSFILVLAIRASGQIQPIELMAYDFMLAKQAIKQPVEQRISMIWINDADQRRYGWPLSDALLADTLETLEKYQPRAIGVDLYRDIPVPQEKGAGYERFQQVIKDNKNIVLITKFTDDKEAYVLPPPFLKDDHEQVGFNDITYDPGYLVRRGLLFMTSEDNWYEYFGLHLVRRYMAYEGVYLQNKEGETSNIALGTVDETGHFGKIMARFPEVLSKDFGGYVTNDEGGMQFMMSYPGAPGELKGINLSALLNGNFDADLIHDKIIIIGTRAEATPDFLATPIGRWLEGEQRMAGAAVHGYAVSQLLHWAEGKSHWLQSWNETEERLWIVLWCLLAGLLCFYTHSFSHLFISALVGISLIISIVYLSFIQGLWLPMAAPIFAWVLSIILITGYFSYLNRSERTVLMNIFSKHVSKDVAEAIWRSRDEYLSEGRLLSHRLTATVLFTDLQNFTSVSEGMEPQALMDWLNEYMGEMVKIVEAHGGQVNKFIGDAVMAIFGVPVPSTSDEAIARDARNAVECALAMRKKIEQLREHWQHAHLPQIRMRVGIFTGPLVAGTLGGIERQEYTVLGDTVNTASRLESFDKSLDADNPCRILVGNPTLNCLDNDFDSESVGTVHLKGKEDLVAIHLIYGYRDTGPEFLPLDSFPDEAEEN